MWDSLSCSFTSIFFLTTSCSTLKTQIKVKEQFVVRKNMDVNEHERLSNITLETQIKVKEQLVVRKNMDVNEHEHPYPFLLQAVLLL
jgi:hypothetical protein